MLAKSTVSIYFCLLFGIFCYPAQEIVVFYQNKPVTDRAISILGKNEKEVLKICGNPIKVTSGANLDSEDDIGIVCVRDKNTRFYSFPRVNAFMKNGRCIFSVAKKVRLGKYEDITYAAGG